MTANKLYQYSYYWYIFQWRSTRLYTPLCWSVGPSVCHTLLFWHLWGFWLYRSCPNAPLTSNMAPAHPHATGVAVYPALFKRESALKAWLVLHALNELSARTFGHSTFLNLEGFVCYPLIARLKSRVTFLCHVNFAIAALVHRYCCVSLCLTVASLSRELKETKIKP